MIKIIFFDFDGVLTLERTGMIAGAKYLSKVLDLPVDSITKSWREVEKGLITGDADINDAWESFCKIIKKDLDIKIFNDSINSIRDVMNNPVMDLILKLRGKYKIGLITDAYKIKAEILDDIYDKYFNYTVVSALVGSTKKSKEIFEAALEKCRCRPEECVFIDNKLSNLDPPREMGFSVIHYDSSDHDFNYLIEKLKEAGVEV